MIVRNSVALLFPLLILLPCTSVLTLAQTQTTGSLAGTVKGPTGAVMKGAEVTVLSRAISNQRKVMTDSEGNYSMPLLTTRYLPGECDRQWIHESSV